jgi:hypothetical protein
VSSDARDPDAWSVAFAIASSEGAQEAKAIARDAWFPRFAGEVSAR